MRETLDQYFMSLLPLVAARATCARRAVACVLADRRGRILATGYNGVPAGFAHCGEWQPITGTVAQRVRPCEGSNDPPGDSRRCLAIHAEQNALMNCWRLDLVHAAYVSCSPCFACAKLLRNLPALNRVVTASLYKGEEASASGIGLLAGKLFWYDGARLIEVTATGEFL